MNVLRIRQDDYQWMVDHPMVWFAAFSRAFFGRVSLPGEALTDGELEALAQGLIS